MRSLAPIVLFVYDRIDHTRQTINALKNNFLAEQSSLFIFSDGPRNKGKLEAVTNVRDFIHTIDGFQSIEIAEQKKNIGLAKSVIKGVTEVIDRFGKAIILEDDLITAPSFLYNMNEALKVYKNDQNIFSITGYNHPPRLMEIPTEYQEDVYFCPRAHSWGWATWVDRWNKTDWEVTDFQALLQDKKKQKKYNYSGDDKFDMLSYQMEGFIDSWAIRWDYCHFQNQAVCVYPIHSLVNNIGHDGSGVHSSKDYFGTLVNDLSQSKGKLVFSPYMGINEKMIERFRRVYRRGGFYQLKQIIKKLIFYNTWRARKCQEN